MFWRQPGSALASPQVSFVSTEDALQWLGEPLKASLERLAADGPRSVRTMISYFSNTDSEDPEISSAFNIPIKSDAEARDFEVLVAKTCDALRNENRVERPGLSFAIAASHFESYQKVLSSASEEE